MVQKVYQTKFHSESKKGNCFACCLSSLLDIPLYEIPEFEKSSNWTLAFVNWLYREGLEYARYGEAPKGYAIANGKSSRGILHSVVVKDGELFHDPYPEGEGLIEIRDYFQITKRVA